MSTYSVLDWGVVTVMMTESPVLLTGIGLLVLAIVLSVLSGLIDIAVYFAIFAGIVLFVFGVVDHFFFVFPESLTFNVWWPLGESV